MQVLGLHISCPQYVPAVTENSVYRKFTGSCAAWQFFLYQLGDSCKHESQIKLQYIIIFFSAN